MTFAQYKRRALAAALSAFGALVLAGCGGETVLDEVRERGVLRVATVNAPTTYYIGREGPAGYERDLALAFAEYLGVELEIVVEETIADVLASADAGAVDIAAAGLTITEERRDERRFGPAYQTVNEIVTCGSRVHAPTTLDDLERVEIAVAAGSAHIGSLTRLADRGVAVNLTVVEDQSWAEVMDAVSRGQRQCTVLDDHELALQRRYTPNLRAGLALPETQALAWAVGGGDTRAGRTMQRTLAVWFRRNETRRLIDQLEERYYGFDPAAVADGHAAAFRRAIDADLDTYRPLFEAAAERTGVPWTLLAAVAYQESHWDPKAKSPTGVRGLMMLTRPTARELGIKNRLDPEQSVDGGSRYLARLADRFEDEVGTDERWWFAAAAYNIGFGHVADARALVARRGGDPNAWADVRAVLPMLEDPKTHATLRYGYARGREAQLYVRRVRDYADVLEKRFAPRVAPGSDSVVVAVD